MHNFQNKVENISVELSHMSSCDIMITDRWNYRHAAHVFFGHKWQFYKSIKRSPNKLLTGLKLTEMSFCAPTSHFVIFFDLYSYSLNISHILRMCWIIFIFTEYIHRCRQIFFAPLPPWFSTTALDGVGVAIFIFCLGWGRLYRIL